MEIIGLEKENEACQQGADVCEDGDEDIKLRWEEVGQEYVSGTWKMRNGTREESLKCKGGIMTKWSCGCEDEKCKRKLNKQKIEERKLQAIVQVDLK